MPLTENRTSLPSMMGDKDRPRDHDSLAHSILTRHSTRKFLPKPVPIEYLKESLLIAQHAPSSSNTQPWRAIFLSGSELESLKAVLLEAAHHGSPHNTPLPERFRHYKSELGHQLFGEEMGIARDDIEARNAAVLRNFNFFGAPLVGIIYMDMVLSHVDSMGVGMWLQTLILDLTERGLDTCVEVSIAGFPQVIERQLEMPSGMKILCGLAVGYGDSTFRANRMVTGRDGWEQWMEIRS